MSGSLRDNRMIAGSSVEVEFDGEKSSRFQADTERATQHEYSETLHTVSNALWHSDTRFPRDTQALATTATTEDSMPPFDSKTTILLGDQGNASRVFRMGSSPIAPSRDGPIGCGRPSLDPLYTPREGTLLEVGSLIKILAAGAPIDADDRDEPMTAFPPKEPPIENSLSKSYPIGVQDTMKGPTAPMRDDASETASKLSMTPLTRRSANQRKEVVPHRGARKAPDASSKSQARSHQAKKKAKRPRSAAIEEGDNDSKPSPKKRRLLLPDSRVEATSCQIVGPASNQMQTVHQMVAYMQNTYTNVDLVDEIVEMVDFCTERHFNGESAYKNLPGAIMDHALEILNPEEFLRVFELFRPGSCQQPPSTAVKADPLQQQHILENATAPTSNATAASFAGPEPYRPWSPVDATFLPNLVEVGVGYGFHLASRLRSDMDVDLHTFLVQGAQTVVGMSNDERRWFWKYLMDTNHPPPHSAEPAAFVYANEGSGGRAAAALGRAEAAV